MVQWHTCSWRASFNWDTSATLLASTDLSFSIHCFNIFSSSSSSWDRVFRFGSFAGGIKKQVQTTNHLDNHRTKICTDEVPRILQKQPIKSTSRLTSHYSSLTISTRNIYIFLHLPHMMNHWFTFSHFFLFTQMLTEHQVISRNYFFSSTSYCQFLVQEATIITVSYILITLKGMQKDKVSFWSNSYSKFRKSRSNLNRKER